MAELAAHLPGTPRVLNLEPASLDDVLGDVRRVAAALGEPARGRRVAAELRERVEAVRERSAAASRRPRVAVLEWLDPVFAAGHWTPELVAIAGGVEVLGKAGERSAVTTWEAVARARPDVLVLACCGWPVARTLEAWREAKRRPEVAALAPVAAGRAYVADGSAYFSRPGPRLADSLEILATLLHPGLFAHLPDPFEDRGVARG